MNLQHQFLVLLAVFSVLFFLIGFSAYYTGEQVNKIGNQAQLSSSIIKGVYHLSYLSNDYLFHPDASSQSSQWESTFADLSRDIALLNLNTPQEKAVADRISEKIKGLRDVYTQAIDLVESTRVNGRPINPDKIQELWSRSMVQSQGIIFDGSELSWMLNEELHYLHAINNILILLLVEIFLLILIAVYIFFQKRFLASISEISRGTRVIGSGNLDFRIEKRGEDEIGSLVDDFNWMAENLKEVTTSCEALEHEIAERKLVEEEVEQHNIVEQTLLQTLSILNATIESTEDGILVMDNAGNIAIFNQQFLKIWHIPDSVVQAKDRTIILGFILNQVKNPDPFIAKIQDIYTSSEHNDYEIIELVDGHIFEWYSRPQKIGDTVAGRVWSFRDVTSRRRMELQIEKSLKEKEILLKEIHHRVKNNMQVISSLLYMQGRKTKDEHAKEIIRESQNRIASIALVHEKIYQSKDLEQVDYNDYLRKISMHLFDSYMVDSKNISLVVNSDTVFLPIDKAVPCSLIINELVSNSIKYAFPDHRKGTIHIDFQRQSDIFLLVCGDDGVGIDQSIDLDHTDTLGVEIVKGLVRQLNGTIDLDRRCGTVFIIKFPV
ncbi:MAG TPA: histidine kinase dimerization/phosphoacceptor domain -containing protein [Methanospirillum sp.]|nr:histidine kinase dimerization/phosphoacceptor domain -containing protein [Methanospirillum sp.]